MRMGPMALAQQQDSNLGTAPLGRQKALLLYTAAVHAARPWSLNLTIVPKVVHSDPNPSKYLRGVSPAVSISQLKFALKFAFVLPPLLLVLLAHLLLTCLTQVAELAFHPTGAAGLENEGTRPAGAKAVLQRAKSWQLCCAQELPPQGLQGGDLGGAFCRRIPAGGRLRVYGAAGTAQHLHILRL
mmetsp:Transcript_70920/g.114349  ORF Transcript_70920/g.114349 Transcript_70920/m.114349 type:complete len:185 (+) Transcript_70920:181-735(+)